MAINIQSLFSDIIETPAQRQERMLTEGILKGRELTSGLTGLARTQAPLVSAVSMQMPQRQDALRRSVGGLLGLDVRTDSERVQDALSNVDPSNPKSILQAAQMIGDMGMGAQAAQMRQMAAEVTRQRQADLMAQQQFSMDIAQGAQSMAESTERTATAIQNRILAQQRQEQELSSFEQQQRANEIANEEAQFKLERLRSGEASQDVFGNVTSYPNGVTTYVTREGTPITKDINGNILTGDEALQAIQEGANLRVQEQQDIYQARELGRIAPQIAQDALEQIPVLSSQAASAREAARLILEEGAATSELEAFLTPLNQATRFLDSIIGELTLGELSQVTMGALSESELDLLKATAAPRGFNDAQIAQWYIDKANAVEKALQIHADMAKYFSNRGATPEGWLLIQEQIRAQQPEEAQQSTEQDQERQDLLRDLGIVD